MSRSAVHDPPAVPPTVPSSAPFPATVHPLGSRWGAPRCGYAVNAFIFWLASRCRPLGYFAVYLAALLMFLFTPRARRASAEYLDRVHSLASDTATSRFRTRNPFSRAWHTYRHMVTFGKLLLDRTLILSRPDHGYVIDCLGVPEFTAAARDSDRGIILLSSHFGMAEIATPCLDYIGIDKPVHIVMFQNLSDGSERFHALHRSMSSHVHIITTTDPLTAGLQIIAALRKGDLVALRADRALDGRTVNATLLGAPLSLPAGPFLAAELSGAQVFYIDAVRIAHRHYRCFLTPAPPFAPALDAPPNSRDARIAAAAGHFAAHLDGLLRRHPHQWSNFFDLWRSQPPK